MAITGLSGNEIYCLAEKGYAPGNITVGNSVYSLGILRSIGSSFKAVLGGELQQITQLISDGRETAYQRMLQEAKVHHASGITGVNSELIFHANNIEFLSIGSTVHTENKNNKIFSTSADGQELYAQLDAGYTPLCFAFGNVVYSIGLARGILGNIKTIARGEITEFSNMFNHTRHLALQRIVAHAKEHHANAVLGIKTTLLPFGGTKEMLMLGTASYNPQLENQAVDEVITSDLTNQEMWSLAKMGYAPMRLLLGTSVYSLGLIGNITSTLKSFFRGEISELSKIIYEARENALSIIANEAKAMNADDVVGIKTYVHELGNGLIEFLAIGTAIKKLPSIKTQSEQLPPQAFIADKDTYYDATDFSLGINLNDKNR